MIFAENDGRGHFKPRTTVLAAAGFPFGLAAADYDGDGDLDLFVACYHQRQGVLKNFTFARPVPYHDATNGAPDLLLERERQVQLVYKHAISTVQPNGPINLSDTGDADGEAEGA